MPSPTLRTLRSRSAAFRADVEQVAALALLNGRESPHPEASPAHRPAIEEVERIVKRVLSDQTCLQRLSFGRPVRNRPIEEVGEPEKIGRLHFAIRKGALLCRLTGCGTREKQRSRHEQGETKGARAAERPRPAGWRFARVRSHPGSLRGFKPLRHSHGLESLRARHTIRDRTTRYRDRIPDGRLISGKFTSTPFLRFEVDPPGRLEGPGGSSIGSWGVGIDIAKRGSADLVSGAGRGCPGPRGERRAGRSAR